MAKRIDWKSQLGRRLKLRDLNVFFAVADHGSMAKAAAMLGVTAPTVSEVIADLEHALGVKLFDRSHRGVEPTIYGKTLLRRGLVAFDELQQAVRDIEFLADPTVGELHIGSEESISAAILPAIIQRFSQRYPRVRLDVEPFDYGSQIAKLRDRTFDLVLTRRSQPDAQYDPQNELASEIICDDEVLVAAGLQTRWARRRMVDLAELVNERWMLTGEDTGPYTFIAGAFRRRGLDMPQIMVKTRSVYLRTNLLATGEYIASFPRSVLELHADRFALKILPLDLPKRPWPVAILTLKDRTLSPVVERFIECSRDLMKSMASQRTPRRR